MSLLTRRKVVRLATETTKGTAEATPAIEVSVFDPIMNPTAPFEERKACAGYLGHTSKGVVGEQIGTFSCRVELRETVAGGELDVGIAALLQGCGFKLDTGVWKPQSQLSNQQTLTIDLFEDGLKKQLFGAMGNVTIEGTTGRRVFLNFEFFGKWTAPTDVALPAPTLSAASPIMLKGGTLTIGSHSPKISTFSLNMGNDVQPREDVDEATGVFHFMIIDRDPIIGMDPEAALVATYDVHGLWLAGTEGALSLAVGETVTIAAPKVQHRNPATGDRHGLMTHQLNGQCNISSGDDEVTITAAV